MNVLAPTADFVYGNTRLRARRAQLLSAADYELLLGKDLDGLLGALAETVYRREVEVALARFDGLRRLHEAVRLHLARELGEVRRFYDGRARELVELVLSRFDLHNLLTLLRGQAAGPSSEDALAFVFPLGGMDDATMREIAGQPDVAAAVDLLLTWRLPDPATARELRRAFAEYERTDDFSALELALVRDHLERTLEAAAQAGEEAAPLRRVLAHDVDLRNVLVALRLREALLRGELEDVPGPDGAPYLPGGRIPAATLDAAARAPSAAAADLLAAASGRETWRAVLGRWAASEDLASLERELEAARARDDIGLFATGDPLGLEIPIAFVVAKETEARNLRLLGESLARGLPPEVTRSQLVTA